MYLRQVHTRANFFFAFLDSLLSVELVIVTHSPTDLSIGNRQSYSTSVLIIDIGTDQTTSTDPINQVAYIESIK